MSDHAQLLTDGDRAVRDLAGYGGTTGVPCRPALLVIDMTLDFCGPKGASREEAVRACRTACGPQAWAAVPRIAALIDAARGAGLPVIYTRRSAERLAARRGKNLRGAEDDPAGNAIVAPLTPADGDIVLGKSKPSAFWQTGLDELLARHGCDGVILTGCTTSGCVRATAVDAYNRDLPCLIAEDAVFDRFEASHTQSLFDLGAKYADAVPGADALRVIADAHHAANPPASNSAPR
ncbi:isochorismatase family protein [Citreimonas sp.]|uniref:isochorismatase family protein n=1 Tax=Citreimonas sp. TaxID=3036715 RepID=UPI0035C86BAC